MKAFFVVLPAVGGGLEEFGQQSCKTSVKFRISAGSDGAKLNG